MSNEIWVGPTETHRSIDAALAASLAGDTIYIRAGVYTVSDTTLQHALTIVGVGGEVILTSARTLGRDRGLLTTQSDLTIENITFRGAWSAEGSAAGIVVEGGDLIVRNSKFEQNETGILARDGATGSILIENSRFAGNGWGDATTAAVVAGRGTQMLTVADSYFLENAAGHHILSRAAATVVERSILDDGSAGSMGSSIELPDGGRVVIEDNVIKKGASGANQVGVDFGGNADLAHAGSSLSISSNFFSDASGTGKAVVNGLAGTVADISYNAFYGLATVSEGAAQVSDNVVEALPASESAAPGGSGGSTASAFGASGFGSGNQYGVSAFSSEQGSSVSSVSVGNAGGTAKPAGTTAMDHVFVRGEMPAGTPLQVLLNGVLTPVTMTVQSTYDDGSIKAATLSFATPSLAAGSSVSATLVRGSLTPSEGGGTEAPGTGGTTPAPGPSTGEGSGGGTVETPPADSADSDDDDYESDDPEIPVDTGHTEVTVVANSTGVVITGTSLDDEITVSGGDRVHTHIDGGDGNDVVTFTNGSFSWYKFTVNADGSLEVKDKHATGTVTTLTNVETLKFGRTLYDVETGTTTTLVSTSSGSGSSGSSSGSGSGSTSGSTTPTVVTNAQFDSSGGSHAGGNNIVDVGIVNAATTARPAGFWTFGQVFKQGDLASGQELYAVIEGQKVVLQVDVKNTWDDGSVKHAVLTVATPALAAGATATIDLMRETTPAARGNALTVNQMLAGDLDLKLELSNLNGATVTLDAKTVLANAISAGTVKTWVAGENAIEVAVRARINDQLEAEFDIRFHADGTYTTDVIVRNDWMFTAGTVQINYDVAIKDHGTVVFSQADVNQNQYSTWHHVVASSPGLTTVYGQFDAEYLKGASATPYYDFSFDPAAAVLDKAYSNLQASDQSLMGNAGIVKYMGQSGERADIGPLPEWTAQYLRTMDVRAAENMFAKADAAGSIPWHFRDNATGEAISIEDYPKLRLSEQAYGSKTLTTTADKLTWADTGWTPESSHQPSLTYLPYLVSGSQYYMSETLAEFSWLIGKYSPEYRDFDTGLITANGQIRGQAWMLRDLMNLTFALPDSHPDAAFYKNMLVENLQNYVKIYVEDGIRDAYGELEGFFDKPLTSKEIGTISPWQENYFMMILGQLADQGYADAVTLLNWSAGYQAGRFLQADAGFNPFYGTGYRLQVQDPLTKAPVTTWAEAAALTKLTMYKDIEPTSMPGGVEQGSGYVATARAAMATLARIDNIDGMEAYGVLVEHSPNLVNGFVKDGRFALAFKVGSEGQDVAITDHKVGTSGADNIVGSSRADVLVGGGGNDTVTGGDGADALYGGDGNDRLEGQAGNDALFGGIGSDTLIGGGGNDILRGGSGADQFVFDAKSFGKDFIDDFEIGIDKIVFSSSALPGGVSTVGDILAKAHADADGNAVIDFGDGNEVVLHNISVSALHADMFAIN